MEIPHNHEELKTRVIEQLKNQVIGVVESDHPLVSQLHSMNKGELNFTQLSKQTPPLDRRTWEQIKAGMTSWKENNFDDYIDVTEDESSFVALQVKRNFQALKNALS